MVIKIILFNSGKESGVLWLCLPQIPSFRLPKTIHWAVAGQAHAALPQASWYNGEESPQGASGTFHLKVWLSEKGQCKSDNWASRPKATQWLFGVGHLCLLVTDFWVPPSPLWKAGLCPNWPHPAWPQRAQQGTAFCLLTSSLLVYLISAPTLLQVIHGQIPTSHLGVCTWRPLWLTQELFPLLYPLGPDMSQRALTTLTQVHRYTGLGVRLRTLCLQGEPEVLCQGQSSKGGEGELNFLGFWHPSA